MKRTIIDVAKSKEQRGHRATWELVFILTTVAAIVASLGEALLDLRENTLNYLNTITNVIVPLCVLISGYMAFWHVDETPTKTIEVEDPMTEGVCGGD